MRDDPAGAVCRELCIWRRQSTGRRHPARRPYPELHTRNAYIALFYRALHACGIEFGGEIQLTRDWLLGAGRTFHVLHFHWGIEGLWRRYLPGWIAPLARMHPGAGLVARTRRYWNGEEVHHFAAFLDAARAQGQRLVS